MLDSDFNRLSKDSAYLKWSEQQQLVNELHHSVDSNIGNLFQDPNSRNKMSMQKALLLKAYLNCRVENWEETEISAVDAFRFGQINKDPETISHSLTLLTFALKKKKQFDRLLHILDNLLGGELSEESPELLFLVSLYKADLQKHIECLTEGALDLSQLSSFAYKKVLDKFSKEYGLNRGRGLLFRNLSLSRNESMILSVVLSNSEDHFFGWTRVIVQRLLKLAHLMTDLDNGFRQGLFFWINQLLDFDSGAFFDFLKNLKINLFNKSGTALLHP